MKVCAEASEAAKATVKILESIVAVVVLVAFGLVSGVAATKKWVLRSIDLRGAGSAV